MTDFREAYRPGEAIPADAWVVDPLDRTTYYGATDAATILGVNPFAGPTDVYLEKRERVQRSSSSYAEMGLLLEDAICRSYELKTGYKTRRVNAPSKPWLGLPVPESPIMRVHPDRLVLHERGVLDAKATERTSEYGEPMTAEVPVRVKVQMVLYVGATKRDWCDVVVLPGATRDTPIYRVGPDPELYQAAIAAVHEFHERHVLAGLPPSPDGTDSWREYAASRFAGDVDASMAPATPEQMLLVEELRKSVTIAAQADRRLELAKQRIMELMGERTMLPTAYGTITYRRQAPRANAWEVAKALAGSDEAYREAMEADKAQRTGPRPLLHPFRDES